MDPLEQIYMNRIHDKIIKYCNGKILDFGCGNNNFKKRHPNWDIISYDKVLELTEVKNYNNLRIDTVTACHVFEHIKLSELKKHIKNFKNMGVNLIVASPTENGLSNFILSLMNRADNEHITTLKQINNLLSKHFICLFKKRILFNLTEISMWRKSENGTKQRQIAKDDI